MNNRRALSLRRRAVPDEQRVLPTRREVWLDLLLEAVESYEYEMAVGGNGPNVRKLAVRRCRRIFHVVIGALLALNAACIALLLNFFVFNRLLHLSLGDWW